MATKKRKKKNTWRPSYTATEAEFLAFLHWAFLVTFMFLVIAAIVTTSTKLMYYSVFVGLILAYGVYVRWFPDA